jgi:O-antigen/teichoic acid export membrane protein
MGQNQVGFGKLNFSLTTLWQGSWMLTAIVASGIINYLSNVIVGRMLGPVEYGIFASMVSLSVILNTISGVAQTVITNYVARLRSSGAMDGVGALLFYLLKWLFLLGVSGMLVLLLCSAPLATMLQLPSAAPVVVMSLFLIPTALLPVPLGVQRGLQRFGAFGGTLFSSAIFRLAAVAGSIALGLSATGAVAALPISSLAAFGLGMVLLSDVLRRRKTEAGPRLDRVFSYSTNTLLALVCFAVLTNGDVILVKSRFAPTEAGLYSAIAVLGKTTLWLSGAVAALLLPKTVERHARRLVSIDILRTSLLVVGGLCGGVTAIFFLFSSIIVSTLFGGQFLGQASLLGLYGLAMTLYSLVSVWMTYFLAIQEKVYAYFLFINVVLVGVFMLFSFDLNQLVLWLIGVGIELNISAGVLLYFKQREIL